MSKIITISGELSNFGEFNTMISQLEKVDKKPIEVHICSDGGDVYLGWAMTGRILASKLPIITYGWGEVASAATMPYLVGSKRYLSRYCCVMLHETKLDLQEENTSAAKRWIDAQVRLQEDYYKLLAQYTNKNKKFWVSMLKGKGDVELTPEECMAPGICDELI